jgi:transposase
VEAKGLRIRTPEGKAQAVEYLGRWASGGRYAVEAMGLNRWLVNALREGGMSVVVVNPVKLGLKTLGKKTDRQDALEIARRLWLGDIDAHASTYYPDDERYGRRKLLRTRTRMVQIRTQCANQIRSLLNAYGMTPPRGALYHERQLAWLREATFPTPEMREAVISLATVLEATDHQVDQLETGIQRAAKTPVARELQKIPQVGSLTAVTLIEEMGDFDRFRNARASASYAGLVPRVDQSAEHTHIGRLTRRGNPELRCLLGQMAVRLLVHDRMTQRWAAPRLKRASKNKVRIALARRLLVGIVASQRHGEPFDLRRCLNL